MSTKREMESMPDSAAAERMETESIARTPVHRHEVDCVECGGHFFVDDVTYERVRRAIEFDPTDDPFVCSDCEAALGEEERA